MLRCSLGSCIIWAHVLLFAHTLEPTPFFSAAFYLSITLSFTVFSVLYPFCNLCPFVSSDGRCEVSMRNGAQEEDRRHCGVGLCLQYWVLAGLFVSHWFCWNTPSDTNQLTDLQSPTRLFLERAMFVNFDFDGFSSSGSNIQLFCVLFDLYIVGVLHFESPPNIWHCILLLAVRDCVCSKI